MKVCVLLAMGGCLWATAFACAAAADQPSNQQLLERIAALEERVAKLESSESATASVAAARQAQKINARQRMARDRGKYSSDQLAEAEQLYQTANKNWRGPQAKAALERMIQKYPGLNRTGCAILYLAQWAKGDEQEVLLKQAIETYGDCYYGDGVQVGALARFYLAMLYKNAKQEEKANLLLGELRKDYPQALDHNGQLLAAELP